MVQLQHHTHAAAGVPVIATVFISMFLHGSILHIAGNMLYLWIFGNNIEDATGHIRFIAFYLLSGLAAAFTMAFMDPTSNVPMVGRWAPSRACWRPICCSIRCARG